MAKIVSKLRYLVLLGAACAASGACSAATEDPAPETGSSIVKTDNLSGCKGKASAAIPSDDVYVMTTFGGPGESGTMSCGTSTKNGSWYYAASRQRYGCKALIRIEGNGKCVIARTDDYGPDVCVEKAAGKPIIDVSPLVAKAIFGVSGLGWSDHRTVKVTEVSDSEPLGPCSVSNPDPGTGGSGGSGGSASGVSAGTMLTATGDVNLRNGPSTSNTVLDVVPKGATVTAVDSSLTNGFYHVDYDGTVGYSSSKYYKVNP